MRIRLLPLAIAILANTGCVMSAMQIPTVTPSVSPSPLAPTASPSATARASATAEATGEAKTAVVRQPVVRVRDAAGGRPTGDYILAGQKVTVLEISGDWVRIEDPAGWVFVGCLEGLSEKGCEADK